MKVGDRLYYFDQNRRRYAKADGPTAGSIWREHWAERFIVGETRVSWLVGSTPRTHESLAVKLPKRDFADGKCPRGWALSQEQIDRLEWLEVHQHGIRDAIYHCGDYDVLRKVAALLGYEPEKRQ